MKYFKKMRTIGLRSRYVLMAILLAVASVLGSVPFSNSAHAAIGSVTEYAIPIPWQPAFYPREVALGADNQIWHTGYQRISKLTATGSFTQYLRGGTVYNYGIAVGSDGNMWFGEKGGKIVQMATNGTVLGTYTIPSGKNAMRMTLGPDGAVWFVQSTGGAIGKITTSGVITEYSVSTGGASEVTDIVSGPDGNLWFTAGRMGSLSGNTVGKITVSGVSTPYAVPTYGAWPQSLTVGSDGNLWFTEEKANKIGKITTSGTVTEYVLPTADSQPYGITTGSDGALWFTAGGTSRIGRITTAGVVTDEYSVPSGTPSGSLRDIITGNDGAVWYANHFTSRIGRVATELTSQTISFTSTAPVNATLDSSVYTPTASATSGLPVAITVDSSSASVCSIDGSGNLSYLAAGTCTLNANQSGDADYNPAPQVQQSFTVAPVEADTSIALDCPSTVLANDSVTCTITVANDGPAAAENVSLSAVFSSSLTGSTLSGGGTLSGNSISWSSPSLAPSASITLTFSATASTAGKVRLNAALIQTSPDSDATNNILKKTIVVF